MIMCGMFVTTQVDYSKNASIMNGKLSLMLPLILILLLLLLMMKMFFFQ